MSEILALRRALRLKLGARPTITLRWLLRELARYPGNRNLRLGVMRDLRSTG